MAAPAGEGLSVEFEAPEESGITQGEIAFNALQQHLGDEVRLRHYTALWRKDYEGDASNKRYVGGALLVEYTVFADGEFSKGSLTVTDGMVAEEVKTELDSQARKNWGYRPDGMPVVGWVRDYGRNRS